MTAKQPNRKDTDHLMQREKKMTTVTKQPGQTQIKEENLKDLEDSLHTCNK
jgi:hypothetical protein